MAGLFNKLPGFQQTPAGAERVTLRRLNRVEYRNTIRDLMGIDFRADEEFYKGHYPGAPITPGVLLCEAVFQTAACYMALKAREGQHGGDRQHDGDAAGGESTR